MTMFSFVAAGGNPREHDQGERAKDLHGTEQTRKAASCFIKVRGP